MLTEYAAIQMSENSRTATNRLSGSARLSRSSMQGEAAHEVLWELSMYSSVSIHAVEAWRTARGSPAVTIVIIDESFDHSWLPPCCVDGHSKSLEPLIGTETKGTSTITMPMSIPDSVAQLRRC
jgi:hypothetical protein